MADFDVKQSDQQRHIFTSQTGHIARFSELFFMDATYVINDTLSYILDGGLLKNLIVNQVGYVSVHLKKKECEERYFKVKINFIHYLIGPYYAKAQCFSFLARP